MTSDRFAYIAKAQSNIALIKYWGKDDSSKQWPANDSVSMTLKECYSETKVTLKSHGPSTFAIGGTQLNPNMHPKPFAHLKTVATHLGRNAPIYMDVSSINTFPMGSGIASSASGFSALTLSLVSALTESASFKELAEKGFGLEVITHLARLGSGSACRSLFGGYAHWLRGPAPDQQQVNPILCGVAGNGQTKPSGSSLRDLNDGNLHMPWGSRGGHLTDFSRSPAAFATKMTDGEQALATDRLACVPDHDGRAAHSSPAAPWILNDLIAIVSTNEKQIPSSEGHRLAQTSPNFAKRRQRLPQRTEVTIDAIKNRDFHTLGAAMEEDVDEMLSIMSTQTPAISYLEPKSREIIHWVKKQRARGIPVYFTVDAGPNVHVLFEPESKNEIVKSFETAFPNTPHILDQTGEGPRIRKVLASKRRRNFPIEKRGACTS
jgi:mevalonate pyrophosphate decarboxylase